VAQRVLAVLGAVAIVLAAIVARAAIDDSGGGDSTDRGGRDDGLIVACDVDLEELCRSLDGLGGLIVEESATTSLGVVEGTLDEVDAWITSDVWYQVTQGRADGEIGTAELLATSPVVVAVDPARTAAVTALCRGQALWRCLGDHAGEGWSTLGGPVTWGRLSSGLPDADTATGLSVLASVAVGYFDRTAFAANDFPGDFATWLDGLTAPAPGGDPDPAATLVARQGTYSTAGSTDARVSTIPRPIDRLDATPTVEAGLVLVDLPGGDDPSPLDELRDLLAEAGWTAASGPPEPPFLPGVMAALHTLWTEVTR
jgi:hypothetical protein